jgi:hypothetical protein
MGERDRLTEEIPSQHTGRKGRVRTPVFVDSQLSCAQNIPPAKVADLGVTHLGENLLKLFLLKKDSKQ